MTRSAKSHQSPCSQSVIWLTPPAIIDALGPFDLDPSAAPDPRPFVTAAYMVALPEDGLAIDWGDARVWLNPPWGTAPLNVWLPRMADHGRGTALVPVAPETRYWWSAIWPRAHALLFTGPGRLHFHHPDGRRAAANCGNATALVAYGAEDMDRLAASGISGQFQPLILPRSIVVVAPEGSWMQVVRQAVADAGGEARLRDLYRTIASMPKAARNPHWRAKVRQKLQRGNFRRVERGLWALAA